MSLAYTDVQKVTVSRSDGFRIATVNQAVKRLVENDQSFFGSGCAPGIWERRWYNDAGNESLYYRKGDAVWVNTEQADEFVTAHQADIDAYVQGCAAARYRYLGLSAANDRAGIYKLYKDMALGQGDFDKGIYYLGNLLDPVQIRVSLSDGNDRPPNDDRWWADFFDRSRDEEFYRGQIVGSAAEQLSAAYGRHLAEYHLSGLQDPEEFYSRYLKADLTNLSKVQKLVNHAWYQPDMTGFDHALAFGMRRLGGGQCQWFRIWRSGMLEHGGTVNVGAADCGSNDEEARLYTVDFRWGYDGGKTAPGYDYPASGIGGFYSLDRQFYTGHGVAPYSPDADALGAQRRYVVDVSPILDCGDACRYDPADEDYDEEDEEYDGEDEECADGECGETASADDRADGERGEDGAAYSDPYPLVETQRFRRYPGKDVTKMDNRSFTFLYSPGIPLYSYYVRGFTVNKARAY